MSGAVLIQEKFTQKNQGNGKKLLLVLAVAMNIQKVKRAALNNTLTGALDTRGAQ